MSMRAIALEQLEAHPLNSNVMSAGAFAKLRRHIEKSDRYPPVIVRSLPGEVSGGGGERFQILDGHHRVAALRELGRCEARCVVWEVDEAEALVLLATLNRLQGQDDPARRAALLEELASATQRDLSELSRLLPEDREGLERLMSLRAPMPEMTAPPALEAMPVAMHFFLLPGQKRAVERKLREAGGTREEALLRLLGVEGQGGPAVA